MDVGRVLSALQPGFLERANLHVSSVEAEKLGTGRVAQALQLLVYTIHETETSEGSCEAECAELLMLSVLQ